MTAGTEAPGEAEGQIRKTESDAWSEEPFDPGGESWPQSGSRESETGDPAGAMAAAGAGPRSRRGDS